MVGVPQDWIPAFAGMTSGKGMTRGEGLTRVLARSGRWCALRSDIKEEAEGRGTVAEQSAPPT